MADLTIAVQAQGPSGWVDLDDLEAGYELHGDSFSSRQTTHRTSTTSGGLYIPGTFTDTAVPDTVTEPVAVIVEGDTIYDFRTRVRALKNIFDQVTYQMTVQIGNAKETWTCFAADYTEETQQEYFFATICVFRVQVPHLPDVVLEEV